MRLENLSLLWYDRELITGGYGEHHEDVENTHKEGGVHMSTV